MKVREFDLSITQIFKGIELDLFISNNTCGYSHLTMFIDCFLPLFSLKALQDRNIGIVDGIGVIIAVGLLDVRPAIGIIEPFDRVDLRFTEVDRSLIESGMGSSEVHLGDHLIFPLGRIDHHEILLGGGAEADLLRRIGILSPIPALACMVKRSLLFKVFQHLGEIFSPKLLSISERKLKGSTLNVAEQDEKVIRVDQSMFGRFSEKVVRIFNDELIEGLASGNEDHQRLL